MADVPVLFERYRIVRKLGSGAFATVYLADDLKMGRPVAVKVVEHAADVEDRVVREAQAAAKLNHHHILTVYEMIREPDRTYLITEYIQGRTLRDCYREQSLTDAELLEVGVQLCRALEHAHQRGVVHRDIKPENIMLVDGEFVDARLMDFGVAQLEDRASITLDGDLVGTVAYMSPEQIEGKTVDSRSDVYSLALTLYEGFTRRNPRKGKKLQELLRDVSRPDIPPLYSNRPDLPEELSDVLDRAMARDRYLRPDAGALGRSLSRLARLMPEDRPAPGGRELATRIRKRLVSQSVDRDRVTFVGRHLVSGLCALACLAYVLPRVPFYPLGAIVPVVAGASLVALLWPFAGGTLALALMAPPVFAYAPGWGVIYMLLAVLTMGLLRWRRREWAALLPGLVPVLAPIGMGLALLPLAGVFLRRWGPWIGFLSGLLLAVCAGITGWDSLPYVYTQGVGPVLEATRHMGSPATVLLEMARFADLRPELVLETGLAALFSFPWFTLAGESLRQRMWGASAYLICLFLAFVLVPILLLDVPVNMGPFMVAYAVCAIITFLITLLTPFERASAWKDGERWRT